ncbi:hypothetical protein Emed_000606 [Eimeria media]
MIQVTARRELPSLHSLPRKLDFGAVRPGNSTSLKVPLSYKGGEGTVKALLLSEEEFQELRSRTSACASEGADPKDVSAIQRHRQPHRQQHTDAFSLSTEQVILRKGTDTPSLTVTFAPKAAGTFAAWLVFVPAESVNLQPTYGTAARPAVAWAPQPIGIELSGIGDLALLTLSEFCGTRWPVDLVTMLPICAANKLQNRRKNESDASKPQPARNKACTSGCEKPIIVREERLNGKALSRLAKTIFPQEIDFGGVMAWCPHDVRFMRQMLDVPRQALFCPESFFDNKKMLNLSKAAKGEHQEAMNPPRWLPLFVESTDSQALAARERRSKSSEGSDWKMLRLQLRVRLEPAVVVVVGASPAGDPFSVTDLSPGLVQEVPLWVKNQGLVDIRVSLPSSALALKALWRRSEPNSIGKCDGSKNKLTSEEGWSTAWLLRVDEQELDELQRESDPVRAHSRTTRALLLYNNANVPTVARVRILAFDHNNTKTPEVLPSDGATVTDKEGSYSGDFPCYFCSSLLRAPSSDTAELSTEASLANGETTCSGDARVHSKVDPSITPRSIEFPVARRCCTSCLCVDSSMRLDEPFVQDPERAATSAAEAARSDLMHAGKEGSMHQQHECLLEHLAQWDHQHRGQQLQEQKPASAVIALSGLLVVYPSYVVLPARGQGVILFTLRASHPQDISVTTLGLQSVAVRCLALFEMQVETLEGSISAVVPLQGRVRVPRLRLSRQHLQLPPLHVLHTHSVQQQLTIHNDSDLPVRIKWNTATELMGSQHNQLLADQQREPGEASGIAHAPASDNQAALLVSLYPSECILQKRSSVSLQISCLGLRPARRLQATALCHVEGSVLPLQVSFAAKCNGFSVTYALLSKQQLLAAAALLKRRREDRQRRAPKTQKKALRWREKAKVQGSQCDVDAACWRDTTSCDSTPRDNERHRGRSTERRDGSNSRGTSSSPSHSEDHNDDNPADICAALQEAGIGLWGSLQEQPAESSEQRHQAELTRCDVDAGGEASFLYLFVCNCCPIPAKVTLQAFTHNTWLQQQQQQQTESSERHPPLSEEGRPAEAFACADCTKNQRRSVPGACEKTHTQSWLVGRNIASCSSGRRSCPSRLTAEGLIEAAASARAPLEMQQLHQSAFGGNRPSFKTPAGIQTLHGLAGQRRRQHLISDAQEELVLIPHPESTCSLGQNQHVLLAVEIFAGYPGDFHAALKLSLEPSTAAHPQTSLPQQRQEVLFPLLIRVRGRALVLPPLQQRIRFGLSRPPVLTAQMTLRAPSSAEPCQELQQQRQACLQPTCYRSNNRLLPLKKTAEGSDVLTAAAETGTTPCPEDSLSQQPEYVEQRVTFTVQNNSCRWVRVKWKLFDLGLWELQQQLQEQLELAYTLKLAAIEALHERAVSTAKKAAAAAEAAASAAATTPTPTQTLPLTSRKPLRSMPARAPDPAMVAAEAAAAAAVAAEEAAFYATEAANAAAATGMEIASEGWEAIAAATATAMPSAAGSVEREGKQDQQEHLGAADVVSPLHEEADSPMLGIEESAMARGNHPISAAAESKEVRGGVTCGLPARSAEATKRTGSSEWREEVTKLIPPSKCLISVDSPVSAVARGVAAATEVLRFHKASNSSVATTEKAAPSSDETICAKEGLVSDGDCEATEGPGVPTGSLALASEEAETGTNSSVQISVIDSCGGALRTCSVESYAAKINRVECQLQEETGGVLETSRNTRQEKGEVMVVLPPRIEPEEAIIAPYDCFEVSLHFGRLQTAEGMHRLRAIALPEPLCPEKPKANAVTDAQAGSAGECIVACGQAQRLTAGERAKPHLQQGRQDFVKADRITKTEPCVVPLHHEQSMKCICGTSEVVDSESRDKMRKEEHTAALHQASDEAGARSAAVAFLELEEPQRVLAEPLVLDFELATKRPCLQLSTADNSPRSYAAKTQTGHSAAEQNLGTLHFVSEGSGLKSSKEDGELTAVPVFRELVLQPALCCGPISFRLSLKGQAFKLHRAELEQQHQHQERPHTEAKPQKLVLDSKASMLVTLHPLQQLKLLLEYSPPTMRVNGVTETNAERESNGEISAFFPLPQTSSRGEDLGDQRLMQLPRHQQAQHLAEEAALIPTLLSGILNLLHPNDDPRPLLRLGLAALQEGKMLEQGQVSQDQQGHLHQGEVLLKEIDATFPKTAKAASAALTSASNWQGKMGALSEPLDCAEGSASSSDREGFTQTVSLVGMCRHVQLLLLAPTAETSTEQQQEQQQHRQGAASGWASYTNIQSPLVIDFNTSHVNPRRLPSRILKLRAVAAMPVQWQISHCNSSCTTIATVDNTMSASCGIENQQARAKREITSAFELSCVKGTLASHRDGEGNKTEVTICIRFM